MLKEERQQEILDILARDHRVIAKDLSIQFKVSEDTIRRDLKELDEKHLLKRVHSGALKVGPPDLEFEKRESIDEDIKAAVAKKALPLLRENSVILIDGGSTNLQLVKAIPLDFTATIITNSPPISLALAHHQNIEILLIGGTLNKEYMVTLGIDTVEQLSDMRADLYVMGVYHIDSENGLSVPSVSEALVRRKMISISAEVLAMVTSDKFETVSNQIIAPVDVINYLITDDSVKEAKKIYEPHQILVM